jgi:hypothetical protein
MAAAPNVAAAPNLAALVGLTNDQLYNDANAMVVLLDTIGIDDNQRTRIINDGFPTMSDLVSHYENNVNDFKKYLENINKTFATATRANTRVYYNPRMISKLLGVLHYFDQAVHTFHMIPDMALINNNLATQYGTEYKNFVKREKGGDDGDDDVEVKIPNLTGATNWVPFRDAFMTKLASIYGTRGIPLDYIVDGTERQATRANAALIAVDNIQLDDPDLFRTQSVHFGRSYKNDNHKVWNLLKGLLLSTPSYNHISSFNATRNGRGAWLALKTFYEGEDFRQRLQDSAFTRLNSTFYKGETNRYSFEKYVQSHKEAHKMLEDSGYNGGLGMDDATKVQHFKTGIKADAGLENSLSNVRANPRLQTFDNLVSFLSAEVEHRSLRKKQLRTSRDRTVSSATTGKKGNYDRSGRGGGNNNGRGGNDSNAISKVVGGKRVYAKQYSKEEFGKLTSAQRSAVIKLNREARNKNRGDSGRGNNINTSSIQSLRNDMMDDMINVGDAIVAGVTAASNDNEANSITPSVSLASSSSSAFNDGNRNKRKAPSGSVGQFIRSLRRNRNGDDDGRQN